MKPLFIFLLNTFCCITSFSQETRINKRDSTIILKPDIVEYNLQINEESKIARQLPFERISFSDVRYDTSFIAINWQINSQLKVGRTFKKKLTLTDGLANGLTNYFKEFYKDNFSSNSTQLLCFVKKFSITLKKSLSQNEYVDARSSNVNLELECYYKSGNLLFPAIRFDTTYEQNNSRVHKTFPELIKDMINPFIDRVNRMDAAIILKRNSYSEEQIQKRYQSRFNIPVLTTNQYVRGVYKNFSEFKNNAPSITNFKIKTKGWLVVLYDSADNMINTLDIFGFCDGNTSWIQHGVYCYPLVRFGNSFEFLYQVASNNPSPVLNYAFPTFKFLLSLDMDTGKID